MNMVQSADIVVAGAGHNSLITACYLAKAGYGVLAVDARHIPGGGAATEEMLGPGYRVDSCSTGHTLIQGNPLMVNDELGLLAEHGLEYAHPDPVAHVMFPDGKQLTHYLDLERTVDAIAHYSAADAAAYRRLITEWADVKHLFNRAQFSPLGHGRSLDQMLDEHPMSNVWKRRRVMSSWDVIRHEFSNRHIRSYMLWQAYQTMVRPDSAGSGPLAYSIVAGRQEKSWSIPLGGSGKLTDALVACFESYGGRIETDVMVDSLLLDRGRAVGVRAIDGREFRADVAVLSTIHVKRLVDMAPAESWDHAWRYGVSTYDSGAAGFAVYLGTTAPPVFETADGPVSAVSAGYAGWPEDILDHARIAYDGGWQDRIGWMLAATPTLVDQSRVPVPGHQTVKLLNTVGHVLPEGSDYGEVMARRARELKDLTRWMCPSFTDDVVVAEYVKGPIEFEESNPAMVNGAWHGGDRGITFAGPQRPAPGWAQHRTPILGLYQTGATTYPGGSVTGGPGRNAARIMIEDLGKDFEPLTHHDRAG